MSVRVTQRARWPWYGFGFGSVLFVFAFGSAGTGHGSFLPLAMFAAPLSMVPLIGFFAAPIWWAAFGWLLAKDRWRSAILMMGMHTIAVSLILWLGTPGEPGAEQWRYFREAEREMPLWMWSGIGIHVMGAFIAWLLAIRGIAP